MKRDITTLDDVKLLVDTFYKKVREDQVLKDIFNDKLQDRWPEHLEKMYRFWQTVLLDEHTYYGSPFPPHAQLAVDITHFNEWIALFFETVDENFDGINADKAKMQGARMAEIFNAKISYFRNQAASHEN